MILNGPPRSGKTSIARALQECAPGVWVNLGVDGSNRSLSERHRPGIGLRPGGERPDLEDLVVTLYAALWDSVAAHARLGLNVVVDVGIHDVYAAPHGIVRDAARRLSGLPVLVIGVRCPIDVILQRREQTWGHRDADAEADAEAEADADQQAVTAVERWQSAVDDALDSDLEVDSAAWSPARCAYAIVVRLGGPSGSCLAAAGIA